MQIRSFCVYFRKQVVFRFLKMYGWEKINSNFHIIPAVLCVSYINFPSSESQLFVFEEVHFNVNGKYKYKWKQNTDMQFFRGSTKFHAFSESLRRTQLNFCYLIIKTKACFGLELNLHWHKNLYPRKDWEENIPRKKNMYAKQEVCVILERFMRFTHIVQIQLRVYFILYNLKSN